MPRDRRLWVKVATDIGRHPKMADLSDAAFRAYIECLAHAKELNKDGFVPTRDVRRWMPEFMELLSNDPTRPSVVTVDGGYLIHDYTSHQESAEAVERRREASRANGALGGRPPKPRNLDGIPHVNPRVKAESRVQSPEVLPNVSESQSLDNRASGTTDSFEISEVTKGMAARAGIKNLEGIANAVKRDLGITLDAYATMAFASDRLNRAKSYPDDAQAYVLSCITKYPGEVEKIIYDNGWNQT